MAVIFRFILAVNWSIADCMRRSVSTIFPEIWRLLHDSWQDGGQSNDLWRYQKFFWLFVPIYDIRTTFLQTRCDVKEWLEPIDFLNNIQVISKYRFLATNRLNGHINIREKAIPQRRIQYNILNQAFINDHVLWNCLGQFCFRSVTLNMNQRITEKLPRPEALELWREDFLRSCKGLSWDGSLNNS